MNLCQETGIWLGFSLHEMQRDKICLRLKFETTNEVPTCSANEESKLYFAALARDACKYSANSATPVNVLIVASALLGASQQNSSSSFLVYDLV
jgi:hypothetical protein